MSRINKIQNMINITNKVEPKTETTEAQIPEEKIVENKTYETQNSAINLENTKSEDAEKLMKPNLWTCMRKCLAQL